jgi:hypothetical protein
MAERRFNEEEVAAIFAKATETQQTGRGQLTPLTREGITLADLEDIARQVGIAPEALRQAASSIGREDTRTSRRFLGVPIGVGRTVDLGRTLSDLEWDLLVGDLRQTFDATGRVKQDGAFRQWSNGNLQVALEPTATGHRLRLRTFKGNASIYMSGGLAVLGIAAAMGVALAIGASANLTVAKLAQIAILGAGIFGFGAFTVPGWARRRRQQMDAVIERLTKGS